MNRVINQLLFPRLERPGVRALLAAPQLITASSIDIRMQELADFISYAPSGGSRAALELLEAVRQGLLMLASEAGYPAANSAAQRSSFDAKCGPWMIEAGILPEGEALRDDVWAFLTCCVAPELVLWRFQGAHPDRFHGGVRNAFQRLWLRARVLDRGADAPCRWELVQAISEDAAVQIIERPSIGAEPELARSIAEAWLATATRIGPSRIEAVTREAVRRIRMANEIVCFSALDRQELLSRVIEHFERASAAEETGRLTSAAT